MHESPGAASRRLVVIRHARAEQVGRTDFERALADEGRRDAATAGRWLAAAGIVADAALVSAAERAVATWEALAEAAEWTVTAALDRGLYAAGPDTALDLVRETDDAAGTLVVVGHNPTVASLAQLLDDGEGDPEASTGLMSGFPPGSLAVFSWTGAWRDLDWAAARVTDFFAARR